MYKLYAILIGVLITIMISFNSVLSAGVGNIYSLLIIHIVGLLAIGIILIYKKQKIRIDKSIPIYYYFVGFLGCIMVFFNTICFNEIGATLTLTLGIFGQLIASYTIDHFGLFGMTVYKFNKQKLISLFIIMSGIIVMTQG